MTLLVDFDGVIGTEVKYTGTGSGRAFLATSSRDSAALRRMVDAGWAVVIVTASRSRLIEEYAQRHGAYCVASRDKLFSMLSVMNEEDIRGAVAIGDDISDIPMLKAAGRAFCPADAHPALLKQFTPLKAAGGRGVIQEIETLLKDDKVY